MIQIPVYFSRMVDAAKDHIFDPCKNPKDVTNQIKAISSSLSEIAGGYFALLCDGGNNLLGDNVKQSSKYKRIIYIAKINAALKCLAYGWDIESTTNQYLARESLIEELSRAGTFATAVCRNSGINPNHVGLGIDTPLFYYAASVTIHDPGLSGFVLLIRNLNKKQLQKLKTAMDFADKTDVFPLLGEKAKPAKRKYKNYKIKKKQHPFHQLVDAFIARREKEQQTLSHAKSNTMRKRER